MSLTNVGWYTHDATLEEHTTYRLGSCLGRLGWLALALDIDGQVQHGAHLVSAALLAQVVAGSASGAPRPVLDLDVELELAAANVDLFNVVGAQLQGAALVEEVHRDAHGGVVQDGAGKVEARCLDRKGGQEWHGRDLERCILGPMLFVTHCEALVVDELDRRKGKVKAGKVVVSVLVAARGANLASK